MKSHQLLFLVLIAGLLSCRVPGYFSAYDRLPAEDKKLADSLLLKAMDNEALYTINSGLKPMSSVGELYFPLAQKDTALKGKREAVSGHAADLAKIARYQAVANSLQFGDLRFLLAPFKMNQGDKRAMFLNVYRQSLVDSLVAANQVFYGQFGFVPGTLPEVLISTTEYEHKYDRYRSYGYLFGYPEHAVTFFVEASRQNDRDGVFVKRDFLQVPVYSVQEGRFVYAVPLGHRPQAADSAIIRRAAFSLERYKKIRARYTRADSSVHVRRLFKKLLAN